LLDEKGVETVEHVVDSGEKRHEMIERAGGQMTVPQIFIDGRHIGGCDDLLRLDRTGKLDELLAA
jgi:glutaredoxin 3